MVGQAGLGEGGGCVEGVSGSVWEDETFWW